jgi:hypothetical protein
LSPISAVEKKEPSQVQHAYAAGVAGCPRAFRFINSPYLRKGPGDGWPRFNIYKVFEAFDYILDIVGMIS